MRIEKFVLHNCLRLALSNIKTFTYEPKADVQVILGANGSGKSSIVKEANPLPSHHSHFGPGGYKYFEFTHNNKTYVAESRWVNSSFKHFFTEIDNGIKKILNDGGTATAQRDIVKDLFGLTAEINALLLGLPRMRFTDMTTNERRTWITRFSPVDLSYAFKLFGDLRTAGRDTTGAYKHIASRISVEAEKLMEMGDVSALDNKARAMREELNVLLLNKEQGLPALWDTENRLNATLRNIERISNGILKLDVTEPVRLNVPKPHNVSKIDNEISKVRVDIGVKESSLELYTKEFISYENFISALGSSGASGIDELNVRLTQLGHEESQYRLKLKQFFDLRNTAELKTDTENVINLLEVIFSEMPDNYDKKWNQAKYKEQVALADELRLKITRKKTLIGQIEERIHHLQHGDSVTCPKCDFKWIPGVGSQDINELTEHISKLNNEIDEATVTLETANEYIEAVNHYTGFISRYRSIVNNYPRMTKLWDALLVDDMFYFAPSRCLMVIKTWVNDLNTCAVLESISKQCETLKDALDKADQINKGGSGHIGERSKYLEETIEALTNDLLLLRAHKAELERYKRSLEQLETLKAEIGKEWQQLEQIRDTLIAVKRDELIESCITTHQNNLAIAQHTLNQKATLEGIVNDHKKSLESLALDKDAYDLLISVLSPTSGFIAEQLMGSIEAVVQQLNAIINAIWTYDLCVEPCGFEDNELDYKFPMTIESPDNRAGDVGDGSSAQQDIVNLAFRLLAYSKLGLHGFPLFMDEVGVSFDEQHRYNLVGYINELMQTDMHSQVFMISHYAASYGSFLNADVVVVNPNNITVPDTYNEHVQIENIV